MKKANNVNILVVGDIMLDKYVVGNVSRISPEAPVPVVNVSEEYYTLGGCGNVVRNIRSVGANVDCISSIAHDHNGESIADELDIIGVGDILIYGSKQTTVKERIISDHRQVQMLRLDRETTERIDSEKAIEMFQKIHRNKYDIIIVSDYAKGMITKELMDFLHTIEDTKIIIDPKPSNGILYNNVFMITPNEQEWNSMLFASAYQLKNVQYILRTLGRNGMELIENQLDESWIIESDPVDIYNVSGAGDAVVAIMGICISMGWNVLDAAYIANKCAAYVVTQPGTSMVPQKIFEKIIVEYTTT